MVLITKSEKETIMKRFPDVHIVRTMKQHSSRHRYYMVEEREPMRLLRKLRGIEEPRRNNTYGKRGNRRKKQQAG